MYHSIIIQESLKDKKILEKYKIIQTKLSSRWHLHIVEFEGVESFIKDIQGSMVSDQPYYFHIYNAGKCLKVIFKDKVFNLDPRDKGTWTDARNFGAEKLNIPAKELDFFPKSFAEEEEWLKSK